MFIAMFWIVIGVVLLLVVVQARWSLSPLREEARLCRNPVQFTFVDLYGLIAVLGIVGAAIVASAPPSYRTILLPAVWTLIAVGWFYGVWLLSRAGIKPHAQRLFTALFTVPLALYGCAFALAAALT